jgi:hypothetical protein
MDDFDAKNHIRDMHRYAEQRQLEQLVQQGEKVNRAKPGKPSIIINTITLLTGLNHSKNAY